MFIFPASHSCACCSVSNGPPAGGLFAGGCPGMAGEPKKVTYHLPGMHLKVSAISDPFAYLIGTLVFCRFYRNRVRKALPWPLAQRKRQRRSLAFDGWIGVADFNGAAALRVSQAADCPAACANRRRAGARRRAESPRQRSVGVGQ